MGREVRMVPADWQHLKEERVTPISSSIGASRKMDNSDGVTHAAPQMVERKVLSVAFRDGMEISEEVRIMPNTRKAIK